MKYKISIKNVSTSEIRTYEDTFDDDVIVYYQFSDGNYSCDCNRELFFKRVAGEVVNWNRVCSDGDYLVHITNTETGDIVYREFYFLEPYYETNQ